jgi:hypothetical protein
MDLLAFNDRMIGKRNKQKYERSLTLKSCNFGLKKQVKTKVIADKGKSERDNPLNIKKTSKVHIHRII